jgi:RNA polymerase sigma-70 factor (ECF subfamily)
MGEAFDAVLAAARLGEPWAFETIYTDLAPSVIGYLRAQGAAEPEDVTQEVFVGVIRNLSRFSGDEQAFRSWVFTIAHRRLTDERRRRGRSKEEPVEEVADAASAAGVAGAAAGDAAEEALGRLGTERIQILLDRLTPDQREVVVLRVLVDLSVAQVAEIVGKNEGAVKTLQRRAFNRLAKELEREGVS